MSTAHTNITFSEFESGEGVSLQANYIYDTNSTFAMSKIMLPTDKIKMNGKYKIKIVLVSTFPLANYALFQID